MPLSIYIIEDEKPAQDHLIRIIQKVIPDSNIIGKSESVSDAVAWLSTHQPDLIFMDIELLDGKSFLIFEKTTVKAPVIFTTAYDQYAIKAFKVNSIDYLLKPIDEEDVKTAYQKYLNQKENAGFPDIHKLLTTLQNPKKEYQERFMVNRGERLMTVPTEQIAFFEGEDRYVYLYKKDGSKYIVDYRLSDLEEILDPKDWFRVNRSFICHITSIKSMVQVSKSRIKLSLDPEAKREIIISSENSSSFKKWLNQ